MYATKEYAELNRLETLGLANAGIVHDINNQLMMILNHLEGGNLHAARYAARNCASFTSSLIDFAKARQGPPLRALDLTAVVAASAVSLNIPDSISLCLELGSAGAPILGDFTGITRIPAQSGVECGKCDSTEAGRIRCGNDCRIGPGVADQRQRSGPAGSRAGATRTELAIWRRLGTEHCAQPGGTARRGAQYGIGLGKGHNISGSFPRCPRIGYPHGARWKPPPPLHSLTERHR